MKATVRTARHVLGIELLSRGANVGHLEWKAADGKGPDDLLANRGQDFVLAQMARIEYNTASGWEARLLCTDNGKPKPVLQNVRLAVQNAPEFAGLALNEFADRIARPAGVPWGNGRPADWSDNDSSELAAWLQMKRIDVTSALAYEGVRMVAARNSYHPVRDYLESLVWDGEPRVDLWLTRYAGVRATNYTSLVGRCWLIAAVARIFQPGCKADSALLTVGKEGIGKSTLFRVLGGEWFSDNLPDLSDQKESANHLMGYWIIEMSELASLNKAALNLTKAFLSRAEDVYRPYYGRTTVRRPRQSIFGASSNAHEPLRDTSGNRRFWPVMIEFPMDIPQLVIDRDQLWAEAVLLYREGARWWIEDDKMIAEATRQQSRRVEQHIWHDVVASYAATKESVRVPDVLREAIRKEIAYQTQPDKNAVAAILQSMGWKQVQRRVDGKPIRMYLNPEYLEIDGENDEE